MRSTKLPPAAIVAAAQTNHPWPGGHLAPPVQGQDSARVIRRVQELGGGGVQVLEAAAAGCAAKPSRAGSAAQAGSRAAEYKAILTMEGRRGEL